ncbi:MAG: hypothetical protein ACJAVK_000030 [Akkermansiaceae bacterium]
MSVRLRFRIFEGYFTGKNSGSEDENGEEGGGESFHELLRWDIDTGWSGVRLGHTTFVVLNALKELCFFRFGEIVLRDHFSGALEVDL